MHKLVVDNLMYAHSHKMCCRLLFGSFKHGPKSYTVSLYLFIDNLYSPYNGINTKRIT